jgi:hypothetical protein
VSDIAGEIRRCRDALSKPTLKLLGGKYAAVVLAVFTCAFSRDKDSYPVDEFHVLVESLLGELKSGGEELKALDDEPPRKVCRRWVDEKWLAVSADNPQKQEIYTLTSHGREAIGYVNSLVGDRSVFGESRIRTIIDSVRRCAEYANPDRGAKIARLDQQIAELTAERDRLAAGEEIVSVTADKVFEEYLNIREMLEKLPSDFLRLSERVKEIQRIVVEEFRQEGSRAGEVVDIYLDRSRELMADSLEGRAFGGAVELLRDEALITQLRRDLELILQHPFAETLNNNEAADFRRAVSGIRRGIDTVLERRRRLSASVKTFIASHDPLGDRELDTMLRRVYTELAEWSKIATPRAKVPLDLGIASLNTGSLRTRFYNPSDHAPPAPLMDTSAEAVDAPTLEQLRQVGGPSMEALRTRLLAALATGASISAASMFNELPVELRRPVEVLGLIRIASTTGALEDHAAVDDTEIFETIRADGSRRRFVAPTIRFGQQHRPALVAASAGDDDKDPS